MSTISQSLRAGRVTFPASVLLDDGDSLSLDRAQILLFSFYLGRALNGHGIQRKDRVAILLPDGASLCLAFLGVSNHCIAVPLNPSASLQVLLSSLEDLEPRAILLGKGSPDAAHEAASRMGLTVIDLESVASRKGKPDSDKAEPLNSNLATLWR